MKKATLRQSLVATGMALSVLATPFVAIAGEFNQNGSTNMLVSANVESTYSVSIPASLELTLAGAYGDYSHGGEYTVGAKGNIMDSEHVYIKPAASVHLDNLSVAADAGVDAYVTQGVNTFKNVAGASNETVIGSDAYANTNGQVGSTITRAGSYEGNLNFDFGLTDNE